MAPKRKREYELADEQRDWRNLPTDILFEIYQRLDDKTENKLELRRIRSVCSSWRSSLLPLTSTTLQFPFKLPPPSFLNSADDSNEPYTYASLSQSDLFLFPPPSGHQQSSWIVKVEQQVESSKWRLENPFLMIIPASFEHPNFFRGTFDIFDCNVKEITRSYLLEYGSFDDKNPKKAKAVISWNGDSRDKYDDFTVLVLFHRGKLGLWRPGEASWSIIPDPFSEIVIFDDNPVALNYSYFSDILTFEGKFYAITMEARLITIDPTTYEVNDVITSEQESDYDVPFSHLVESNGRLYLVHKEAYNPSYEPLEPLAVRMFMLDAKNDNIENRSYCWNAVNNLENDVFFATDYVTFSISAEDLGWSDGNYVILPCDECYCLKVERFFSVNEDIIEEKMVLEGWPCAQYFADCLAVYSLQDSKIGFGRKKVGRFAEIFWPPPDWLLQLQF